MIRSSKIRRGFAIASLTSILLGCQGTEFPKPCGTYAFDGEWAQKQIGNKCVTYNRSEDESILMIYESDTNGPGNIGTLTIVSNGIALDIERYEAMNLSQGPLPHDTIYEFLGKRPIDPLEEPYLFDLLHLFEHLPINQGLDI